MYRGQGEGRGELNHRSVGGSFSGAGKVIWTERGLEIWQLGLGRWRQGDRRENYEGKSVKVEVKRDFINDSLEVMSVKVA